MSNPLTILEGINKLTTAASLAEKVTTIDADHSGKPDLQEYKDDYIAIMSLIQQIIPIAERIIARGAADGMLLKDVLSGGKLP